MRSRCSRRLEKQSGGFGCILDALLITGRISTPTKRSYELFARHVLPHSLDSNIARDASLNWVRDNGKELMGKAMSAAAETVQKHFAEGRRERQELVTPTTTPTNLL